MKKIVIVLIATICITNAKAQSYSDFIRQIIENSPQLNSLKANYQADSLSFRRGLMPDDPELELEYFFGESNSYEITVAQSFDFPSLYILRNKASKYNIRKSNLVLNAEQRVLMLEAAELYQLLVYTTNMERLLRRRTINLNKLDSLQKVSLNKGNTTILEVQKIDMMLIGAQNELETIQIEKKNTLDALKQFNVKIENIDSVKFGNFSFWGEKQEFISVATAGNWEIQAIMMDSLIAEKEIKIARNQWIPKLTIGYRMEMENNNMRNAIVSGISIPIWNKKNDVKYSKAKKKAVVNDIEVKKNSIKLKLSNIYDRYIVASNNLNRWDKKELNKYEILLKSSFENGNITMLDYLIELTNYQTIQGTVLSAEYQKAQTASQMSIYLM